MPNGQDQKPQVLVAKVLTDSKGNVFVAGSFTGNFLQWSIGAQTVGFVLKYNVTTGQLVSQRKIQELETMDQHLLSAVIDSSDNIHVCGYYTLANAKRQGFVYSLSNDLYTVLDQKIEFNMVNSNEINDLAFDSSGTLTVLQTINQATDSVMTIFSDVFKNPTAYCSYASPFDIHGAYMAIGSVATFIAANQLESGGGSKSIIIKCEQPGIVQSEFWAHENVSSTGIAVDPSGYPIYLTGTFTGEYSGVQFPSSGGNNGFLIKVNSTADIAASSFISNPKTIFGLQVVNNSVLVFGNALANAQIASYSMNADSGFVAKYLQTNLSLVHVTEFTNNSMMGACAYNDQVISLVVTSGNVSLGYLENGRVDTNDADLVMPGTYLMSTTSTVIGNIYNQNVVLRAGYTSRYHIYDSITIQNGYLKLQPGVELILASPTALTAWITIKIGGSLHSIGTIDKNIIIRGYSNIINIEQPGSVFRYTTLTLKYLYFSAYVELDKSVVSLESFLTTALPSITNCNFISHSGTMYLNLSGHDDLAQYINIENNTFATSFSAFSIVETSGTELVFAGNEISTTNSLTVVIQSSGTTSINKNIFRGDVTATFKYEQLASTRRTILSGNQFSQYAVVLNNNGGNTIFKDNRINYVSSRQILLLNSLDCSAPIQISGNKFNANQIDNIDSTDGLIVINATTPTCQLIDVRNNVITSTTRKNSGVAACVIVVTPSNVFVNRNIFTNYLDSIILIRNDNGMMLNAQYNYLVSSDPASIKARLTGVTGNFLTDNILYSPFLLSPDASAESSEFGEQTPSSNIMDLISCKGIQLLRSTAPEAVYTLYPNGYPMKVRCNALSGLSVLARRYDGSISFDRTYDEYVNGFGDLTSEFWLGLKNIHILTRLSALQLSLSFWSESKPEWNTMNTIYPDFQVGNGFEYTVTMNAKEAGQGEEDVLSLGNGCTGGYEWFTNSSCTISNFAGSYDSMHIGAATKVRMFVLSIEEDGRRIDGFPAITTNLPFGKNVTLPANTEILMGALTIAGTLIIEPGVKITVEASTDILVTGVLLAQGTYYNPIIIKGKTPSAQFDSITLSSAKRSTDMNGEYIIGTNILQYVNISNGVTAVNDHSCSYFDHVTVSDCTQGIVGTCLAVVKDSRFMNYVTSGIVFVTTDNRPSYLIGNSFEDVNMKSIYVQSSHSEKKLYIHDNIIHGSTYGIDSLFVGSTLSIKNNKIYNTTSYGISVNAQVSNGSHIISDNHLFGSTNPLVIYHSGSAILEVQSNFVTDCTGSGLYLINSNKCSGPILITKNTWTHTTSNNSLLYIEDCGCPFSEFKYNTITNNVVSKGIYSTSSSVVSLAGLPITVTRNIFLNNDADFSITHTSSVPAIVNAQFNYIEANTIDTVKQKLNETNKTFKDGSKILYTPFLKEFSFYTTDVQDFPLIEESNTLFKRCDDIHKVQPLAPSGVYAIYPLGELVYVRCDMSASQGLTVFQRRTTTGPPNRISFNTTWVDYVNGFGNPEHEYWMGLKYLHLLTSSVQSEMYAKMFTRGAETFYQSYYPIFKVNDPDSNYTLQISGVSGDRLLASNGEQFATIDRDNDAKCANQQLSAFWFDSNECINVNPNGIYSNDPSTTAISWIPYTTEQQSLEMVEMSFVTKKPIILSSDIMDDVLLTTGYVFYINNNITVYANLIIQPGVTIYMKSNASLYVSGSIYAMGTPELNIYFIGETQDSNLVSQIQILAAAPIYNRDSNGSRISGSLFEHVQFRNAINIRSDTYWGVNACKFSSLNKFESYDGVYLVNSEFVNDRITSLTIAEQKGSNGIHIIGTKFLKIRIFLIQANSVTTLFFSNNEVTANEVLITGSFTEMIVHNSTFNHTSRSIYIENLYENDDSVSKILDNIFGYISGSIILQSYSSFIISRNIIAYCNNTQIIVNTNTAVSRPVIIESNFMTFNYVTTGALLQLSLKDVPVKLKPKISRNFIQYNFICSDCSVLKVSNVADINRNVFMDEIPETAQLISYNGDQMLNVQLNYWNTKNPTIIQDLLGETSYQYYNLNTKFLFTPILDSPNVDIAGLIDVGFALKPVRNCLDIQSLNPKLPDAIYSIELFNNDTQVRVRCENGSIVVQQRTSDLFPTMNYIQGFGSLDGSFWLGLESISMLTIHGNSIMKIVLTGSNYTEYTAEYNSVTVAGNEQQYQLQATFVGGNAGNGFGSDIMPLAYTISTCVGDRAGWWGSKCSINHNPAKWSSIGNIELVNTKILLEYHPTPIPSLSSESSLPSQPEASTSEEPEPEPDIVILLTGNNELALCEDVRIAASWISSNGATVTSEEWKLLDASFYEPLLEDQIAQQPSMLSLVHTALPVGQWIQLQYTVVSKGKYFSSYIIVNRADYEITVIVAGGTNQTIKRKDIVTISAYVRDVPACYRFLPATWTINSSKGVRTIDSNFGFAQDFEFPSKYFETGKETLRISFTAPYFGYSNAEEINLQVLSENPVASIKGGTLQSVMIGNELLLSGVPSYDPEYTNTSIPKYMWTCSTCTNKQSEGIQYIFKQSNEGTYTVTLQYIPDVKDPARVSTTTVVVSVTTVPIPQISISTVVPPKISSKKIIKIEATVGNIGEMLNNTISFNWIVTEKLSTSDVVVKTTVASRQLTPLIIPANTLLEGKVYEFKIRARYVKQPDVERNYAYASITTTTTSAPTIKNITISPTTGTALITNFQFSVEASASDPLSYPLSYSISYLQQGVYVPLRTFSNVNEITTKLPTISNATELLIQFSVRNSYGDTTTIQDKAIVLPLNTTAGTVINNLESMKDELLNSNTTAGTKQNLLSVIASTIENSNENPESVKKLKEELLEYILQDTKQETLSESSTESKISVLSILTRDTNSLSQKASERTVACLSLILQSGMTNTETRVSATQQVTISNVISNIFTTSSHNKNLTQDVINIVAQLREVILQDLSVSEPETTLSTLSFNMKIKKDYGANIQSIDVTTSDATVVLPDSLDTLNSSQIYSYEFLSFKQELNPYSWSESTRNLTSTVVSFKIISEGQKVPLKNLTNPIEIVLNVNNDGNTTANELQCMYWDETSGNEWDSDGCIQFDRNETHVICHCSHTTSFASFIIYDPKQPNTAAHFIYCNLWWICYHLPCINGIVIHLEKQSTNSFQIYCSIHWINSSIH
jgi:ficolin